MTKWIAEFELEDGDTMPEHMDLEYMGAKIDFHCRPLWISVNKRLPEIHQDVLLELRSGEILTGFRAETESYFYVEGVDGCYVELVNVIAWMPLPESFVQQESVEV